MKKILPPTYFASSILLIAVLHYIYPLLTLVYLPYNFVSWIFIAAGAIMNISADKAVKKINSASNHFENTDVLVKSGVFAISRNPVYVGMSLILFGESILLGSLSSFLIVLLFIVVIQRVFIIKEEKIMLEKFGNEYTEYKKKVRRWI